MTDEAKPTTEPTNAGSVRVDALVRRPLYLTAVLRIADNAVRRLVYEQLERLDGAKVSAAAWWHVMDERDRYKRALQEIHDYATGSDDFLRKITERALNGA